jgi:hypothetical protein
MHSSKAHWLSARSVTRLWADPYNWKRESDRGTGDLAAPARLPGRPESGCYGLRAEDQEAERVP